MRYTKIAFALAAFGVALSLFTPMAQAGTTHAKVDCHSRGAQGKIATILGRLDPADTNVVQVSGHCHENLVIRGFDRLSLIAQPGTVIEDASGGQAAVVDIEDSREVVLQDFAILGGNNGVYCVDFSFCRLIRLKIEQTVGGNGSFGALTIQNSQGQLIDSTIQDSAVDGISLGVGSKLQWRNSTVSNARGNGVSLGGKCQLNGPNNTVKDSAGFGIVVNDASSITIGPAAVTGNGQGGILVAAGSSANLFSVTVTDNQGSGISLQDGSLANMNGTSIISNNKGPGISLIWGSRFVNFADTTVTNNQFGLYATDVSLAVLGGGTFTQNAITDISCDGPPPGLVLVVGNIGNPSTDCQPPLAPSKVLKSLSLPSQLVPQ